MHGMLPTLVEVKAIARHYGPIVAVQDVSFEIRAGEILGFLGPNGAGKTTTMQILTGNLAPSAGSVTIAGHSLASRPKDAKQEVGYLPEQPPLYRELRVDEYLDYCAALHRIPRPARRQAREAAKDRCGLGTVGTRLIANLSKGFQQRVGLAQAIIHMPRVLVLDEPTVGLDPIQIREIRDLIRMLGKDRCVILSTHILSEVEAVCDHVQIINRGRLVLSDTIDGVRQRIRSHSLFLAFRTPPDRAVLEALPGVQEVRSASDGRIQLFYEPDRDPTEQVLKLAAEHGWGLQEVTPTRGSLEELFVELTATGQIA